ncbi:MAG TPA: YhjD/YihY/BrkB family envelope integrity protein [Candidatus Limnocylindrales bacterium]
MTLPPAIRTLVDRVVGLAPVRTAMRVLKIYGDAGGGLLAGGLTYSAVFAVLPSLLLLTGLVGFMVTDPERRAAIVGGIGRALPPLEGLVTNLVESISKGSAGFGLLGLLGLAWGASHFYGSLDDAFSRIFLNDPKRGFIARTVRGLLSVMLLVTVFVAALGLTGIGSYIADQTATRFGGGTASFWQIASPALAAVVFVSATVLVYRVVPGRRVSWSALWLPALVAGVLLALLTQLFSFIAPRLIGVASVYAAFVAVFAAMVWLSTGFQILLIGAAWVRDRTIQRHEETAMPSTGTSNNVEER